MEDCGTGLEKRVDDNLQIGRLLDEEEEMEEIERRKENILEVYVKVNEPLYSG